MTRVLVVDDEAPILRALIANLRARGFEPAGAATGEDALRVAAEFHPDAVVLDLGLPGISGWRSSSGFEVGTLSRSSFCRRATLSATRWRPSMPGPMIT